MSKLKYLESKRRWWANRTPEYLDDYNERRRSRHSEQTPEQRARINKRRREQYAERELAKLEEYSHEQA